MTDDEELRADADLAERLRVTWSPFFGRFGRLRPVQRSAMPAVLDGEDALLVAPTASGKTEAACAPLVEREFGRPRWTILYVSPTRALVNDLYERLVPRMDQLNLTIRRRTGDHRDPLAEPPNLLLTTPESFDSLLCRGRSSEFHHVLGHVSAVVLDEVHLVHGTARGEQLRWLLYRLRRIRAQLVADGHNRTDHVQVVALSATVPDPNELVRAYLAMDARIVSVGGTRPIVVVAPTVEQPDAGSAVTEYVRTLSDSEKLLVFSNARKRVDALTRQLTEALEPSGFLVRAHHGSLAQKEREATERAMKRESRIVVCATMTLEIGIDIGDVDLVVLDSPAPSVASLLQRVGRGNRRTDVTRLMMCSGSLVESLIHAAMLARARVGDLGETEGGPQFAVARQQIASYIFQASTRSRPRAQLEQLIQALLPDIDASRLLDHLIESAEFEEDRSGVRLGADWQDSSARGSIHSNIEDAGGYQVVDVAGGQVGTGIRSQSGRGIGVAGKLLEVKGWDHFKILVQLVSPDQQSSGDWSYVSRAWMRGAGQPRAVQSYLGIPLDDWPVLRIAGDLCVFHFGGTRRRAVLRLIEQLSGTHEVLHLDEWTVWLPDPGSQKLHKPRWLQGWTPSQLEVLLTPDTLTKMERLLARPVANRRLPIDLRTREVSGWLGLEDERASFAAARWELVRDPAASEALRLIAGQLRR